MGTSLAFAVELFPFDVSKTFCLAVAGYYALDVELLIDFFTVSFAKKLAPNI